MRRISIPIWLLATVILLASVATVSAVGMAIAARSAFAKLQYARIFPLGRIPNAHSPNAAGAVRVAFYGDSRVAMWDLSEVERSLRPAMNLGQGAITSEQLLLQLTVEPTIHSEWAVVQIGINDLHPLGALAADKQAIVAQLRTNLRRILQMLQNRADRVVVMTIAPPGRIPWLRRFLWDAQTQHIIDDINELIRDLTRQLPRVALLDASNLLAPGSTTLPPQFVDPDFFLHFNATSYAILNRELLRITLPARTPGDLQPDGKS